MVSPEPRSMPYDWNITTKEFVLRTLTNQDGKEFTPAVEELTVYQMPDTTQGPHKDGIFFGMIFQGMAHHLFRIGEMKSITLKSTPFFGIDLFESSETPRSKKFF